MQVIKEDIKNQNYKPAYLLYGSEAYLKKLYQDKLKAAVLDGTDEMNYSFFEGKGIDTGQVIESAQTLPFFSDKRLIVVKESGLFKTSGDLADFIESIPDTTCIVFVETEVDKRNRLFKKVKEKGHVAELNGMDARNLKLWISSILKNAGKKITEQTALYLLERSGTDMKLLENELEKLICYAYDRDVITVEDIDAVGTVQITGKIFQMIDAIAFHKQEEAISFYHDLLTLREKPMSILFLITRQFNILLQIKELSAGEYGNSVIAQKVSVPPFAVKKYISQAKSFTRGQLEKALVSCAEIEEQVKTGRLLDTLGVELLIINHSRKPAAS